MSTMMKELLFIQKEYHKASSLHIITLNLRHSKNKTLVTETNK